MAEAGADGVIIGSRIVRMIEDNLNDKQKMQAEIADFISEAKSAL
ncbi:MAG: tryptophan synthase subunit alpha [Planctomycetota bacterium]